MVKVGMANVDGCNLSGTEKNLIIPMMAVLANFDGFDDGSVG